MGTRGSSTRAGLEGVEEWAIPDEGSQCGFGGRDRSLIQFSPTLWRSECFEVVR